MLTAETYRSLRGQIAVAGYAEEYEWCQGVTTPADAMAFFFEYGWVVVNSGMKNQVAEKIWTRVLDSLRAGGTAMDAFGHPGKSMAIQRVFEDREARYAAYMAAEDKIAFLAALPWIGPITKWHLAKNFGIECAKPDRHLARLAEAEGVTVTALCERLAAETGDRVATVDLVLWRASNLGLVLV
jgi:hypothetical protein